MPATPRPAKHYKVNSLDRGLAILRAVRTADGPVRNLDLAARTGLPKATVSRLTHTLTTMGYLRRTDQGEYVPGGASVRSGRAMIDALGLERHVEYFRRVLAGTGGLAQLEARIGRTMTPVFRWSEDGGALVASGTSALSQAITARAPVALGALGTFVLCVQLPQRSAPDERRLAELEHLVRGAAEVIRRAAERTEEVSRP